jgi:hypothetical protein
VLKEVLVQQELLELQEFKEDKEPLDLVVLKEQRVQ